MSIAQRLKQIKSTIPEAVMLIAVSKTHPESAILEAYNAGQLDFGENKVQELVKKYESLPKNINWHMIGHLQRNKVKYIAHFVTLIHAVDSLKLLSEINKQAQKNDRKINCLLQIKIAEEDTKFGLSSNEALEIIKSETLSRLNNICIKGVMGMATLTNNTEQIKREFLNLKLVYNTLSEYKLNNCDWQTISMGMSSDYNIAINCGSNMIRVGNDIFGNRTYS